MRRTSLTPILQRLAGFLLFLACTLALPAHADKPSDSYLTLRVEKNVVHGQWDIALRDLDFAIGLDSNGDGALTWDEVRAKHADIAAYALARLSIATGGENCPARAVEQLIDDHTDGAYTVLRFEATCAKPVTDLTVQYHLLFDVDPQHKGLLKLANERNEVSTAIFGIDNPVQTFKLADASRLRQFTDYLVSGVWHIWMGFDHILFLISLLLPAVLAVNGKGWLPAMSFKTSALDVLKIITAFTLAHSITLTLATLQIIALPSRLVESAIAISIILSALNNVYPVFRGRLWVVAFSFGLVHGFGFASVLAGLGLPKAALAFALVGFNVGVELGQLTIVVLFLPIAFTLRETFFYRRLVFYCGSAVIVLVATIWLVERAGNMRLISA